MRCRVWSSPCLRVEVALKNTILLVHFLKSHTCMYVNTYEYIYIYTSCGGGSEDPAGTLSSKSYMYVCSYISIYVYIYILIYHVEVGLKNTILLVQFLKSHTCMYVYTYMYIYIYPVEVALENTIVLEHILMYMYM